MRKVEPMELIENPLGNLPSDSRPLNSQGQVEVSLTSTSSGGDGVPTVQIQSSKSSKKKSSLKKGEQQQQPDDLSNNGRGSSISPIKQSQSFNLFGSKGSKRNSGDAGCVRNRHSSGCLPSDPLLISMNTDHLNHSSSNSKILEESKSGKNVIVSLDISDPSMSPYPTTINTTDDCEGGEGDEPERETWSQGMDFLLSIIGFAVDLANVWRFPYFCYKNGGGAFLIPYILMLALSAVPVFYMELLLGQSIRQGPISLWKICPMFKGIGMAMVCVSYFVSFYYNTIMAWSLHFMINSFKSPLPWTTCNNSWNSENCFIPPPLFSPYTGGLLDGNSSSLSSNETIISNGTMLMTTFQRPPNATSPASEYFRNSVLEMGTHNIDNLGRPKMDLLLCLVVIYVLLYIILFKGIRSTGKVVWVTATLPYCVMAILLARGLMLEGASDGIYYYLVPNMTKLKEVSVWSDAAKQIFFSSGAGFGVHLTYASFNNFHNNCYRDCLVTSLVNCFTSIFAGFVIFTYLGSMALRQGRPIDEVVNVGPGLVFEVYPEAVGALPGSNLWSFIFFLMLIMLGLDSAMGGLECVVTGITDEFKSIFKNKKHTREWFMFLCVLVSFLISLLNITRGGMYTFTFFDAYAAGSSLLFAVLFEVVVVSWIYGLDTLSKDAEAMHGNLPGFYWRFCWKFVTPVLISVIIIMDLIMTEKLSYDEYVYPEWAQIFGYIFTFIPIMFVPLMAIISYFQQPGDCKMKLAYSITPTSEHLAIKERGYVKRFKSPHWLYFR